MKIREIKPNFKIEKELKSCGNNLVAGVDEVGRGALAGPIVAAAVVFDIGIKFKGLGKITDSKIINQATRELLDRLIRENALSIGVGVVKVSEIDKFGIGVANILAFDRALKEIERTVSSVCHCDESAKKQSIYKDCHDYRNSLVMTEKEKLRQRVSNIDFVLIDGRDFRGFNYKYRCIEKGESKSISIAAASIIAKVYRDNLMTKLHSINSIYGFNKHKGYGTKSHIEAIKKHGPSIHHRKSFLKSILNYHPSLLR